MSIDNNKNDEDNSIWIMLRGLTREQRHWEGFPHYFRERMEHATIVLPDLPGSGIHYREKSPRRIGDMVEFVRADVAVHLFDRPVYLLGLSLGAMVALEWARRYPQECAGLVLMNTSVRGLNPFYHRLRPRAYGRLLRALVLSRHGVLREETVFDLTSQLNPDRDRIVANWVRYASELPVSRLNALRQIIAASRYRLPGQKPDVDMLVLRGMADQLVNPECSARLAARWQLPLHSHATAGHDLTLDDSAWVCDRIRQWLPGSLGDEDESDLSSAI